MADVDLVSIIVHRGNQSNFVAADVKNGEFSDLVGVSKLKRGTKKRRTEDSSQGRRGSDSKLLLG
jgi:hypothetical protein